MILQKRFLLLLLIFFHCISCEKHVKTIIPSVPFQFSINVYTDPEFNHLRVQGNAMVITNDMLGISNIGYNNAGVIIYNNGSNEYYAFDRTCPYDFPNDILVELDGETLAKCPECGSLYMLPGLGAPTVDGPAVYPLQEYKTSFNPNTGELNVYN